jgi:wyosine [tRNA(Phe)-imidazoG37] synthetase (radical SAM superfamily)
MFNERIDTDGKCISPCCEGIEDRPRIGFKDTGRETMEDFMRYRSELIAELTRLATLPGGAGEARKYTAGCARCANFQAEGFGKADEFVRYVNLSMYPAPCQAKCIYCGFRIANHLAFDKNLHAGYYERLFEALEYAKQNGMIAPDAKWDVASGEITIHPYKDRIMELVKGQTAVFATNCFIFDGKIADNLGANPRSTINLSIDCGTPGTWRRVKGVDNFDAAMGNLAKYREASARPGQITLKYIVLPGINDNLADYLAVAEIMKTLGTKRLSIARDVRIKYSGDERGREALVGAAARLVATLKNNGLEPAGMDTYAPEEIKRICVRAATLDIGKDIDEGARLQFP